MPHLLPPTLLFSTVLAALTFGVQQKPLPPVPLAIQASWRIHSTGQDTVKWDSRPPQAHDLSAIQWLGGNQYALVSDKRGTLLWGEIQVDAKSGQITSAKILPQMATMDRCFDVEGCAVSKDGKHLVVSDETDARLSQFALDFGSKGRLRAERKSKQIFRDCRENLSLESLATCVDGSGYWTMNEDALSRDGARASLINGAWLRLQKVGPNLLPVRQWAYFSDSAPGTFPIPGVINGVSDLLALPDGRLLVLERGLGSTGFRVRLYLVNPDVQLPDPTDTAHLDRAKGVKPLRKELLFEKNGWHNFEGITLGPVLTDGSISLLLVPDDGDPISQSGLLALKLERQKSK